MTAAVTLCKSNVGYLAPSLLSSFVVCKDMKHSKEVLIESHVNTYATTLLIGERT